MSNALLTRPVITRTTTLDELPHLMRVVEVAKWADVSCGSVYAAIAAGRLRSVMIGRLLRVPREALAEFLQ